jgi:hypothetical protein
MKKELKNSMENNLKRKLINYSLFTCLLFCHVDIYKYGKEFFIQTEINWISYMFDDGFLFIPCSILLTGQILLLIAPNTNNYRRYTALGLIPTTFLWVLIVLLSIKNFVLVLSVSPYFVTLAIFIFDEFLKQNFKEKSS